MPISDEVLEKWKTDAQVVLRDGRASRHAKRQARRVVALVKEARRLDSDVAIKGSGYGGLAGLLA